MIIFIVLLQTHILCHNLQASEIDSIIMNVHLTSLGNLHWMKGTSSSNDNFGTMNDSLPGANKTIIFPKFT